MHQETPHQGAAPSLADGLAAIANDLRAIATAQRADAGIASAMQAAVLFLLASIVARLWEMVVAWQQGLLPPQATPRPARRPRAAPSSAAAPTARQDSIRHTRARIIPHRAPPSDAIAPARRPITPAFRPSPAPHLRAPASACSPAWRLPTPPAFSNRAWGPAFSRAHFVTIS